MSEQQFDIPILSPRDEPLPEGHASRTPVFTLCASFASMAETIARGRKYNPTVSRDEIYNDLRRMLAVAKARKMMTRADLDETDRADLTLFLVRDAGFDVPPHAIERLGELSMEAAEAFWRLVEFMQPYVVSKV